MVETLTESFCERCGTRYEFRAPTRLNPLRKTRGLIGGLKNYLTSQDALSDAVSDAMRSEEEQLAAAQLDAFHQTFNFCINCRQYTCVSCWNDAEGRCRSCAPIPGTDDLADRLMAAQAGAPAVADAPSGDPMLDGGELSRRLGLEAWPEADRTAHPATNGHTATQWPEAEPIASIEPEPEPFVAEFEPEPVVAEAEPEPEPERVVAEVEPEPEPEPEPMVAEVEPEPEPEPVVAEVEPEPEPEPMVAEVEPEPIQVVSWEPDGAFSVVEPEPEPMVAEVEPEPEPVVAEVEPEPERMVAEVEPEPEPVVAEAEPEPEPVVEAPPPMRVGPISETILRFPQRPVPTPAEEQQPTEPESPEVAARRAQLDLLGLGDPGEGPVGPERPAVLPYRSRGATPTPVELAMRAGGTKFWEASAREVAGAAAQIGVQNCGECGLSLSATARFCRRCGTRQARSA